MILAFLISSVLAFNVEVWDVEVKEQKQEMKCEYNLKIFSKYISHPKMTINNIIFGIKNLEFHGGHAILLFSWRCAISSWTYLDIIWT